MLQVQPPRSRAACKRGGFSLMEMLVVTGLFSAISVFTMVLYNTAIGDFEHANTKLSMNSYARRASAKITTVLSTASSRRPGTPVPEAFYYPEDTSSGLEYSYVDFLSTSNFIKTATTDVAYAFDNGEPGAGGVGYTPLFRYRLGWTGVAMGNMPRNSVYLERLNLDPNTLGSGGTPIVGSAAPLGGYRQVLATNINRCSFRRTFGGTMQVRILVYAFDPVTGRGLDGQTMRSMTKKHRHDSTGLNDEKSYELLTAIPLPTLNIK